MKLPENSRGRLLGQIDHQLASRPPWLIVTLSLLFIAGLGGIDYRTGHDFELEAFYLLPVLLTTWYVGRRPGMALACAASLVSFLANWAVLLPQLDWAPRVWNAGLDLFSSLVIVLLLSAWKHLHAQLELAASQDALTGLANRRSFYKAAQLELSRSERYGEIFTLAYLDIDNFKQVNDHDGHSRGDELLRQVSATLRLYTRQTDMVARLGGDEFAILFPDTEWEGARSALAKLVQLLMGVMEREHWPVTFSIGVVTFRKPCASVDELVRIVDDVMYSVKRQGKANMLLTVWPEGRPA